VAAPSVGPIESVGAEAAELLAAIHSDCFAKAWTAYDFQQLLAIPGTVALVATAAKATGADVCGFVLARIAFEDCEILTIGVRPAFRRHGVGRALIAHLEGLARKSGATAVFLEVAEDNQAALNLYRTGGFVEVGRRRDYYRDDAGGNVRPVDGRQRAARDALIMRREIE
jgi:ribosomal-protein-alanine N-acetyltransferase